MRDVGLIRERWIRWFHQLLNTKSSTLDPNIVDELKVWPPCNPLDDAPVRYVCVRRDPGDGKPQGGWESWPPS